MTQGCIFGLVIAQLTHLCSSTVTTLAAVLARKAGSVKIFEVVFSNLLPTLAAAAITQFPMSPTLCLAPTSMKAKRLFPNSSLTLFISSKNSIPCVSDLLTKATHPCSPSTSSTRGTNSPSISIIPVIPTNSAILRSGVLISITT